MLKRPSWILAIGGCAALCAAYQLRVNYRDQDFTLSGFDVFSATLETNSVEFQGSGAPVRIESRAVGLTLTGKEAVGTAQRGDNRAYFLKDLTLSGGAHATMDSGAAANRKPGSDSTFTDVLSDSIHFTGSSSQSRIDFASEATIDSKTEGSKGVADKSSVPFVRTLHVTGSKGFVTLLLGGASAGKLEMGELSGPVNFTVTEKSPSGPAEQTTTLQGSGDQLSFSIGTEPRTITLQGNVKATSQGPFFTGDLIADSMVVTLDAELQPSKIEVKGSPAKTHGVNIGAKKEGSR